MKIVLYQCDWCSVQAQPSDEDGSWPEGWTNLDEFGNDDLLCKGCATIAKERVRAAIEATKAERSALQSTIAPGMKGTE